MSSWTAQKKTGTNFPGKNNLLPHPLDKRLRSAQPFVVGEGMLILLTVTGQSMTDEPRTVTDEPRTVTAEQRTVTVEPRTVTAEPRPVTGDSLPFGFELTHNIYIRIKKGEQKNYTNYTLSPTQTLHSSDFPCVAKCIVCAANYTQTIHKPYIEPYTESYSFPTGW